MTSSGERWACDTSFTIASLDLTHEAYDPCRAALVARRPVLAGHAAFESYSVLTRLPVPLRLTPAQAIAVLETAFSEPCWLSAHATADLHHRLAEHGIVGGSVYDALVGQAAVTNGRTLLTRDRRAERTYAVLGVEYQFVA